MCFITEIFCLTYEIKSDHAYDEFFEHEHLFDFSNLPKNWRFLDKTSNKFIGKMKDESEGKVIHEFAGLKSKMHSIKNIDNKESNTAKGENITTECNEFAK